MFEQHFQILDSDVFVSTLWFWLYGRQFRIFILELLNFKCDDMYISLTCKTKQKV